MLGKNFRPWGEISWLLSKQSTLSWNVVGCISFEDRCLGTRAKIPSNQVASSFFLNILPPPSRNRQIQNDKLSKNFNTLLGLGVSRSQIIDVNLLENVDSFLTPLKFFIDQCNGNIILDISSFPKRFFFPILKRIMLNTNVQNLIITYTKPETYTTGELSWDPSDWSHIPTFMSGDVRESTADLAIISVGFVPLGLPKLLTGKYRDAEVKLLFPHPPGPPNYQRNWEFVRKIVDTYPKLSLNEMQRVHALDLSSSFDKLCDLSNKGAYKSVLAPYGPKPISLSMALFAINQNVPVYYTQPNYYAPDYSSGIRETYAYWIVNNGNNLYTI